MRGIFYIGGLLGIVSILSSCHILDSFNNNNSNSEEITEVIELDTMDIYRTQRRSRYNPSKTRKWDLIHTLIKVSFDLENQHALGQAELVLHPWFYNTSTLELDAKGFDIHSISYDLNDSVIFEPEFKYDQRILSIQLDKTYSQKDTLTIQIKYTAKPNDLEEGGSMAILSDKGLYFIDPLDEDKDKPTQIWTQGETEANSVWFPTIDSPNERMTSELQITVEDRFVTLSNGVLEIQSKNEDNTRTDYWVMEKPQAPYLVMMCIGEFEIIRDTIENIPLEYYLESEYAPYAQQIFGETPTMIEFYSDVLGVPYPWNKYAQVVVRDFVSGAMENTTAVIHGQFVQQTPREMIDGNNEDIIAHELFHHWFGDLVTCESWANLPLNESFATYGEYLWHEYRHGKEAADHTLQQNLTSYLFEASRKQADMIRFDYLDKEHMFDSHSYSKGGHILHMLRKYTGDEAFFSSLKYYLDKHAFQSVEIHELRLAFEHVTGEDLNWFFNQWFLSSGHPKVKFSWEYIPENSTVRVITEQKQNFENTTVYKLPLKVDLYSGDQIISEEIEIDKAYQEFEFTVNQKPQLVNIDAEKILLGIKSDQKDTSEWIFMYYNTPLFLDRMEAVKQCGNMAAVDSLSARVILDALDDKYWRIRTYAMENSVHALGFFHDEIVNKVEKIAMRDEKSAVRSAAIRQLGELKENERFVGLFKSAIKDSSYQVISAGLKALGKVNNEEAVIACMNLTGEKSQNIHTTIASILAQHGSKEHNSYFMESRSRFTGYAIINYMMYYSEFLLNLNNDELIDGAVPVFVEIHQTASGMYTKAASKSALMTLENLYTEREHELNKEVARLQSAEPGSTALQQKTYDLVEVTNRKKKIGTILDQLED